MKIGITLEEVNDLREFGNKLLRCKSLEEVARVTFLKIEQDLYPQVVSLFLFSKDGTLKRVKIKGFDVDGRAIEDKWLSGEEYRPGESFSGKAAIPGDSTSDFPYGKTYYVNNLESEFKKFLHGADYRKKLGLLNCGMSVPLNGTHRTFGTLETLNKRSAPNSVIADSSCRYEDSEVCWLTILGAHVSAAISRIRRKEEDLIYTNISRKLADPDNRKASHEEVYKSITDQFVGSLTPYKACVLREGHGEKLFVIERSSTPDVNFDGKGLEPRSIQDSCLVGEVYQSREPIIIQDISREINRFYSSSWILAQGLKSFICFPLAIQGESVGTISLFTGYVHEFTENDLDFLENISYLLAAYIVGIKRASDAKVPRFEWKGTVVENLDPVDNKVLVAVNSSNWDFRTIRGIAIETNLDEPLVSSILKKYVGIYVRESLVPDRKGNTLYTPISRPVKLRERLAFVRILTARSISNNFTTKRGA
jgi:GAF domain-containing protein